MDFSTSSNSRTSLIFKEGWSSMGKWGYFDEVLHISMFLISSSFKSEQSGRDIFPYTLEKRTFARICTMVQEYILLFVLPLNCSVDEACFARSICSDILNRKHVICHLLSYWFYLLTELLGKHSLTQVLQLSTKLLLIFINV